MDSEPPASHLSPAEAFHLAGLVPIQPGSIVCRTLARTPGGTVILIAFDRQQELFQHTASYDTITYVVEGEADLRIGEKSVVLGAGQSALMPARIPHAVHARVPCKLLLVMVRDAARCS